MQPTTNHGQESNCQSTEMMKRVVVGTTTSIGRSYFDLIHQNKTISRFRKRFGGEFTTDDGRSVLRRPESGPPPAPASGCYLAFNSFGFNLIRAQFHHDSREFPKHPRRKWKGIEIFLPIDPRLLANNTLVPFLVAALEDYFKSTYIALLRYSERKVAILKSISLRGDQLVAISDGKATVEDQITETLSFQRLSAVGRHFEELDKKLDIAGTLRKPYRRRSQSLFEMLDSLVLSRHQFIHKATLDKTMTDERIEDLIFYDNEAITRVYRRITDYYGWFFDRGWYLGRRRIKKTSTTDST